MRTVKKNREESVGRQAILGIIIFDTDIGRG